MSHFTTPEFWRLYNRLPQEVRDLADKNFELLKADPWHPSLHFKKIEGLWSVRIGIHYRAVAYEQDEGYLWFWIGHHAKLRFFDAVSAAARL